MSKQEHDREDLLREATALVQRVALRLPNDPDPWVIGFRRDGAASLFVGAEPAYHFNAAGELRRAYVDGRLFKAERGRLARLTRQRTETEVRLLRTVLTEDESRDFLAKLREHLHRLRKVLERGDFVVEGQVPSEGNVVEQVARWLQQMSDTIRVAARPHVASTRSERGSRSA